MACQWCRHVGRGGGRREGRVVLNPAQDILSLSSIVLLPFLSHGNGPIFGSGADLCISSDCNKNKDSYSQLPYSYGDTSLPQHLLTGNAHGTVSFPYSTECLGMGLLTCTSPYVYCNGLPLLSGSPSVRRSLDMRLCLVVFADPLELCDHCHFMDTTIDSSFDLFLVKFFLCVTH